MRTETTDYGPETTDLKSVLLFSLPAGARLVRALARGITFPGAHKARPYNPFLVNGP